MGQHVLRGVAYCLNKDCGDYLKGVFLLAQAVGYYQKTLPYECPLCHHAGHAEPETRRPKRNVGDLPGYKRVELEFNYDPQVMRYRGAAVVIDHERPDGCGTYLIQSPLIKTEKRALAVAESTLANLNMGRPGSAHPPTIDWDASREEAARQARRALEPVPVPETLRRRAPTPAETPAPPAAAPTSRPLWPWVWPTS